MSLVPVIWVVVVVAVVVAAALSLFLRRHGEADVPAESWRPTDEVFVDPGTSRRMRVWVDQVDGSRHYVPDRHGPQR
jgi:hypothetical protein